MKRKISEKVLARMLFNISKENNVLDEVKKSLQKVEKLLKTNGHFLMLVQSKKINSSIKREILNCPAAGQGTENRSGVFAAFCPLIRMTAIADFPGGVATA